MDYRVFFGITEDKKNPRRLTMVAKRKHNGKTLDVALAVCDNRNTFKKSTGRGIAIDRLESKHHIVFEDVDSDAELPFLYSFKSSLEKHPNATRLLVNKLKQIDRLEHETKSLLQHIISPS